MKTLINKINIILIITLVIGGFLQGCHTDKDKKAIAIAINGKVWTLKYIQNINSNSINFYPEIKEKIRIEFADNKQLIFDGVCNTGVANYALDNDKLTISPIALTKIYCNNISWEDVAGNGLNEAYRYQLDSEKLIIYSKAGYNLVFE
jgi:heat shock protein HslJ